MMRRFALLLPLLPLLAACSSAGESGSSIRGTTCTSSMQPLVGLLQLGHPTQLRVAGDTLYFTPDGLTIAAIGPDGGAPTTVVSTGGHSLPDQDGLDDFWVDVDSLVWISQTGLWRAPLAGGAAVLIAGPPPTGPTYPFASARGYVMDHHDLYGVFEGPEDANGARSFEVRRQPLAGGDATSLARLVPTGPTLGAALFDSGDQLVLVDGAGDSIRIAKGDGSVRAAGAPLKGMGSFFGADGSNAIYGMWAGGSVAGQDLVSISLDDGSATHLWPAGAPTFEPFTMTKGADGTAYVSGFAFTATREMHPAYATLVPGSAPAIAACFGQRGGDQGTWIQAIAPARTVVYASIWESNQWGIVRLR